MDDDIKTPEEIEQKYQEVEDEAEKVVAGAAEVPENPVLNSPFATKTEEASKVVKKNPFWGFNFNFKKKKDIDPKESPFKKNTVNQNIKVGVLSFVAVLLVGLAIWAYIAANKSGILISDSDSSTEILINDKKAVPTKQDDGYYIAKNPGQYTLTIKKGGYVSFTQNINLTKGRIAKIRPTFTILPSAEKQTIRKFGNINFVRPSADQRSIYYLGDNQQIYRMEVANQIQIKITDNPINNIEDVQWSIDSNTAIITQGDGIYIQEINKYDLISQQSLRIASREVISPIWDPINKNRIAFALYKANGEKSLVFSDPLMKQMDRKADLAGIDITNPKLIWSGNSSYIALIGRSSDYTKNNLWVYNAFTGTIEQITHDGYISNASFSPNGEYLLFSKMNKQVESVDNLGILNMRNNEVGQIKDIKEGVEGIAWKNDNYIFVPKQGENYIKLINVTSGEVKKVPFTFSENLNVLGVYYFPENSNLIFYTSDAIYTINISVE